MPFDAFITASPPAWNSAITLMGEAKGAANGPPVHNLGTWHFDRDLQGRMDQAIAVLRGAKEVADLIPVPGLGQAIGLALNIAELVEDVQASKKACRALAERVAEDLRDIYETLDSCRTAVDCVAAERRAKELVSVLLNIENMLKQQTKKRWWKRALRREDISEEIATLSEKLEQAVARFQVKTLINVDRQTSVILEKQLQEAENDERFRAQVLDNFKVVKEVLVSKTSEVDQFRLHAVDVRLIEPLSGEDGEERDQQTCETQSVVRYRSELCKNGSSQAIIVKRYQKKDSEFLDEVELMKKLWHPNILHFMGYSPDAGLTFMAFDMASHVGSFEALSRAMQGIDKVLWVINATKQICDALHHLSSKSPDLQWTPDDDIDPITGGTHLIVTSDSRVLLDVSQCRLDRLPNLVVLYEWTIELNSTARQLVQDIKKDPLANVPARKRRSALCTLWRQFSSFVDFLRDDKVLWSRKRIVLPGECFLRSRSEVLEGLCYDDQLRHHRLVTKYYPALLRPTDNGRKRKKDRLKKRPVQDLEVVYDIAADDIISSQEHSVKERWRRYTVQDMDCGWELLTATTVRESGDCQGWLLNQATRMCNLPLDLEDMAIATGLKFTTRSYLVNMFDKCGRTKPPPTLYFYERVHDYPRASLEERLDWPWGYWSTDPNDQSDIELIDDAHRARRHSIAFLGVAEDGAFRWMQIVADAMFCIDVRVEVECCKLTRDECLILREIRNAMQSEDDYIEPDPWRADDSSDGESEVSDMWEDDEEPYDEPREGYCEAAAGEEYESRAHEEYSVAMGLYWLRVDARHPMDLVSWDTLCQAKGGPH
ncbi:hypothetical protein BV20DRAFT_1058201 [Pilatotrama ljubarskyi]|nr:hypothetical protein BV20DRAFT_1058201 [Pilatotrama ljubarskyi]